MNLTALLLTIGIVTAPCDTNIYPATMIVTNINYQEDYITLTDTNGNSWEWSGVEDWEINDIASCLLSDNSTANIYDDEFLTVQYSGFKV
jgi:hypothetical protein